MRHRRGWRYIFVFYSDVVQGIGFVFFNFFYLGIYAAGVLLLPAFLLIFIFLELAGGVLLVFVVVRFLVVIFLVLLVVFLVVFLFVFLVLLVSVLCVLALSFGRRFVFGFFFLGLVQFLQDLIAGVEDVFLEEIDGGVVLVALGEQGDLVELGGDDGGLGVAEVLDEEPLLDFECEVDGFQGECEFLLELVDAGEVVEGEDLDLAEDLDGLDVLGERLGHEEVDCLDDEVELVLVAVVVVGVHGLVVDALHEVLELLGEGEGQLVEGLLDGLLVEGHVLVHVVDGDVQQLLLVQQRDERPRLALGPVELQQLEQDHHRVLLPRVQPLRLRAHSVVFY